MYQSQLIDSKIILGTFFTENNLNLLIIKIGFFINVFQLSFFLNALFYIDDYISDVYHNNGVLDFVSGLPKSIYSFLATLILSNSQKYWFYGCLESFAMDFMVAFVTCLILSLLRFIAIRKKIKFLLGLYNIIGIFLKLFYLNIYT